MTGIIARGGLRGVPKSTRRTPPHDHARPTILSAVDNITHSLLGAALAKTRLGQAAPFAAVALVAAANLPDCENAVLVFCDRSTKLIQHRGVTHGLLGIALEIPLFALLMWWLGKRFARARPPGSLGALLLGVALATLSHPLLDWCNTYGWRPWLPFDGTWYYGDLLFIVDPWLWLLLGAAVCLAGRRTTAGSIALAAFAVVLSVVIVLNGERGPRALQIAWPAVILALALARWSGFGRRHGGAVVLTTLALAVAYVGFLGWAGRTAWRMAEPVIAAQLPSGETISAHTISPQPANPFRWQIVAETQHAVYRAEVSIQDGPGDPERVPNHLDDPLVQRVADSREGRAWRAFARNPVATIVPDGHGGQRVYLLDARYGMRPGRGFGGLSVDVPAAAPEHPAR